MSRDRVRLFTFVILGLLGFSLVILAVGPANTWKALGIPAMIPHFADASIFGSATESRAAGFDPLYANPCEPEGRLLPYPRAWQLLNIRPADVPWFVAAIVTLFLIGLGLMLWAIPQTNPALLLPVLFSPAVLFGIERGNVDLIIFFILSLATFLASYGSFFTIVFVLLAFVLKLFPICATAVLLRFRKGVFWAGVAVVIAFVVGWILFTLEDTREIFRTTIKDAGMSYGKNVLNIKIARNRESLGQVVSMAALVGALALMAFAALALPKRVEACHRTTDRSLDYFRVGASIYVATFFFGTNYDYKMMFLLFALPQLQFWWSHSQSNLRLPARVALCATIYSVWGVFFDPRVSIVPYGYHIFFVFDELINWTLFASLLYLLCLTVPEWVKEIARACEKRVRGQGAV